MAVLTADHRTEVDARLDRVWWLFLLTGVAWLAVAFVVLAAKPTSVLTIAYMVGFVVVAAGINELISLPYSDAWKWLRAVLGVVFVLAGALALVEPLQTFGVLALLIGWYLLFRGAVNVVTSIVDRGSTELWGLVAAAGAIEMAVGIWAIGYPGRSAWLLLLWAGIGALLRGVTEIATAFQIRGLRGRPAVAA
jgi:uncharacterized membrane protein HdeD (DUF308 family)